MLFGQLANTMARRRRAVATRYTLITRVLIGLVFFTVMTFTMTHQFMSSGGGLLHSQLSTTKERLASFRNRFVDTAANMWHSGSSHAGNLDDAGAVAGYKHPQLFAPNMTFKPTTTTVTATSRFVSPLSPVNRSPEYQKR